MDIQLPACGNFFPHSLPIRLIWTDSLETFCSQALPASCQTHHALRVHQQQVFRQAAVHASQHVLSWVGRALPDQEVSIPDQESLCVPSAHTAVVPCLSAELLLIWGHGSSAARRAWPLVLQDLGTCSCSRCTGPNGAATRLVKLQSVLKRPYTNSGVP